MRLLGLTMKPPLFLTTLEPNSAIFVKEILKTCDNRCLLFNNRTSDELKKSDQLKNLLFLVNEVVAKNGGKPFTNELFEELKMGSTMELDHKTAEDVTEVKDLIYKSHAEQLKRITDMTTIGRRTSRSVEGRSKYGIFPGEIGR
ncbi:immune-associated nucleotide-binding protein 9-like isoform X2 [Henckelia pumila]|uniref:immune-associated nucleotide-binding protein 9-like isoform X2 n=1 Tax=Henckelia pumila TaxID=405737 RepID=UPI003C6DFC52